MYEQGFKIDDLFANVNSETDGTLAEEDRTPNLNMEIVEQIEDNLSMAFVPEKMENACELTKGYTFAPVDILDYIYAVLHSPTKREEQKSQKLNFLLIPYPKNHETFWQLVQTGGELRQKDSNIGAEDIRQYQKIIAALIETNS